MATQHVLERRTNLLVTKMRTTISAMAQAMGGGQDPPFSVKLSEEEQMEQYLSLDDAGWKKLIEERGWAEMKKYSEAMVEMVRKKYKSGDGPTVMGPADEIRAIDSMPQQPQQGGMPGMPQGPMPPQPPMPPGPQDAADADRVTQLIQGALGNAANVSG
jgi:hypothetical protein